jgi:hypothetical protein
VFRNVKKILILFLLLSLKTFAQPARNCEPIRTGSCPDGSGPSSVSDPSARERILGNFRGCLSREGIRPDSRISAQAIRSFENACNFKPRPQPVLDGQFSTRLLMDQFYQDLAGRSKAQVDCRTDTFNRYFNNQQVRTEFHNTASQAYSRIREELEPLALYKQRLEREALMNEGYASGGNCMPPFHTTPDCTGASQNGGFARGTLANVYKDIAKVCTQLPFGYEPEVCEAYVNSALSGHYDASLVQRGLTQTREKYVEAACTYQRNSLPTSGSFAYWCLNDEYRRLAASSGQADELLNNYPNTTLDDVSKKVLKCQYRSEYVVSESRLNWGIGGIAAFGAVATLIPTGGGSAGVALAGVGLASTLVGLAGALDQAVGACSRAINNTTFIISNVAASQCTPEQNFSREIDPASWSSCLINSGLAAVSAVTVPLVVRQLAAARRSAAVLNNAENTADDAARAAASAEEVGNDIVVTANRTGRSARRPTVSEPTGNATTTRAGPIRRRLDARRAAREERELQRRLTESPWSDELRREAREYYRRTGQELRVADNGRSPETALAREVNSQDLFGYDGFLSVDDAVRAGRFTESSPYLRGGVNQRDYWWLDSDVPVTMSRSPGIRELVERHGADRVRRTIGWPNSSISTSGNTTNLASQRYAMNEVLARGADGRLVRQPGSTLEVIARNQKSGDWEPFLYEWVDGRWVQLRTLQGVPVRRNCITCHSNSSGAFTPLPYKSVPDYQGMHQIYSAPYGPTSYNQFK